MLSKYIHLTSRSVDDAILVSEVRKPSKGMGKNYIGQKVCPFCGEQNKPTDSLCESCNKPIDIEDAQQIAKQRQEYDQKVKRLLDLVEHDKMIRDRVTEIWGR